MNEIDQVSRLALETLKKDHCDILTSELKGLEYTVSDCAVKISGLVERIASMYKAINAVQARLSMPQKDNLIGSVIGSAGGCTYLGKEMKWIGKPILFKKEINDVFKNKLPVRALNLLKQNNIITVEDLVSTPTKELLKIDKMGIKTVSDINSYLNSIGMKLKGFSKKILRKYSEEQKRSKYVSKARKAKYNKTYMKKYRQLLNGQEENNHENNR